MIGPVTQNELQEIEHILQESVQRIRAAIAKMRENSMETAELSIESARSYYGPKLFNWSLQLMPDIEKELANKRLGLPAPSVANRIKNKRTRKPKRKKGSI